MDKANKENCCLGESLQTEDFSFLSLSSNLSIQFKGVEAYGLERMNEQNFIHSYHSDPIFKNKMDLMFKEYNKITQNQAEFIARERLRLKEIPDFPEF